jgi:hypothetical protein
MPLVFVHGVNVRSSGKRYEREVTARDAAFRSGALRALCTSSNPLILNPYWGDSGVTLRWNNASLPPRDGEVFGAAEDTESLLLANFLDEGTAESDQVLLTAARHSLSDAIDLVVAAGAMLVDGQGDAPDDLAEWGFEAAAIAEQDPHPQWLAGVRNDGELLRELDMRVREVRRAGAPSDEEGFGLAGVRDRLREAAMRLAGSPARAGSATLLTVGRAAVHAHATRFLGDVFVYILQRERGSVEQPGPIVSTVLDALQAAWDGRTKEDPRLVVVAHSMGGNIMYEILTHYLPGRGSEIRVDVLVTVGSQVGIFEEMKLFAASDPAIPRDPARDRVQKPAAVDRWLNVFDRNDVFSFAAGAVFDGVEDFSYSTGKGLLGAHGAYFALPSFHRRLEARLREVL